MLPLGAKTRSTRPRRWGRPAVEVIGARGAVIGSPAGYQAYGGTWTGLSWRLFRGNRARVISLAAFIGLWQLLSSTGVLIVYAILGLLADAVVRTLERRALAWRPEFGE